MRDVLPVDVTGEEVASSPRVRSRSSRRPSSAINSPNGSGWPYRSCKVSPSTTASIDASPRSAKNRVPASIGPEYSRPVEVGEHAGEVGENGGLVCGGRHEFASMTGGQERTSSRALPGCHSWRMRRGGTNARRLAERPGPDVFASPIGPDAERPVQSGAARRQLAAEHHVDPARLIGRDDLHTRWPRDQGEPCRLGSGLLGRPESRDPLGPSRRASADRAAPVPETRTPSPRTTQHDRRPSRRRSRPAPPGRVRRSPGPRPPRARSRRRASHDRRAGIATAGPAGPSRPARS